MSNSKVVCGRYLRKAWRRCSIAKWYVDAMIERRGLEKSRVWTQLQNGRGVDAILAKFVLYTSEHTPGSDLLSTLSAAAIIHCERSTL